MASTIQIKRGTGSAVPSGLLDGELALNLDNGKLYYGSGSAVVNSFRFTNLTAENYIVSSSVTNITTQELSGSTVFGNSSDDTHTFTGAITASGDISSSGTITANSIVGGHITINSSTISDNNDLTLDVGGDITLDTEEDIIFKEDGTTRYTFRMDSTPEIDIVGDLIIDPSGGDVKFSGANINVEGNISASGHITASGNISASGQLVVDNIISDNTITSTTGNLNLLTGNISLINGHITASGNISSSGAIIGDVGQFSQIKIDGEVALDTGDSATTGRVFLDSQITKIQIGKAGAATQTVIEGNITASSNISASGNIDTDIYKSNGQTFAQFTSDTVNVGGGVQKPAIFSGTTITLGSAAGQHVTASGNISSSGTLKGKFLNIPVSPAGDGSDFSITFGDGDPTTKGKIYDDGSKLIFNYDDTDSFQFTDSLVTNNLNFEIITGTDATDASGDTGALRVEGGASIAKKLFVGTNLSSGPITSSGDISSSGTIIATTASIDVLTGTGGATGLEVTGFVSASSQVLSTTGSFEVSTKQLITLPFSFYLNSNYTSEQYIPLAGTLVESTADQYYHLYYD